MEFRIITSSDHLWNIIKKYAETCSWKAGKSLAADMDNNTFSDWERIIIALDNEKICGFCAVAKKDCIPDITYTPIHTLRIVDEKYRGRRLSQRLIQYAMNYLKSISFEKVYLISDHENLYEKYGFRVIDHKLAPWGAEEKIYVQEL